MASSTMDGPSHLLQDSRVCLVSSSLDMGSLERNFNVTKRTHLFPQSQLEGKKVFTSLRANVKESILNLNTIQSAIMLYVHCTFVGETKCSPLGMIRV